MLTEGSLLLHLGVTLKRLALGVLLGGGPGLLAGLLMGWLPTLRAVLDPFVSALHPLPKLAILPLIMVIFGVNDKSLVVVSALGAFFPMLINTMEGVWRISSIYFEVAENYGASRWQVFWRVVWPGSRPWLLAGLRLAVNTTLLLTVGAEMVSAQQGLGQLILMAWQTMRTEEIYVILLLITLLGVLYTWALQRIAHFWMPWEKERSV
jgi:NitT/TauT family transport system permease protein